MTLNARDLSRIYGQANDLMRNIDGLQPQEAFDELLKYLFFKEVNEEEGPNLKQARAAVLSSGSFTHADKALVKQIQTLFAQYLNKTNSWSTELWLERKFRLSDKALCALHELFNNLRLADISLDIRSAALKEFMPPEMRKGLGIYLTPDDVVRMAVAVVQPKKRSKVYDPACGSGTFLIETLKYWGTPAKGEALQVWGSDKNPRMLLLSELNIGHARGVQFKRRLLDALFDIPSNKSHTSFASPNAFDFIFTNPPFGVYLDAGRDAARFETFLDADGGPLHRQQSEIVFVEQCLRLLRPGGTLAIVLPKSVITNTVGRISGARSVFDTLGYVYALALLPPETFHHMAGTQTTTAVLFMRKYLESEKKDRKIQIACADVKNVGYDSTGRDRTGNDLLTISQDILAAIKEGKDVGLCKLLPPIPLTKTMQSLPKLLSGTVKEKEGVRLGEVAELIKTGRTPPRTSYTDTGLFVIKVGNLTGNGINWIARDRNFVSEQERIKRTKTPSRLIARKGDIVLTSSAHSPVYIAKKVDIVDRIPEWVGGQASFVGEVMLIRVKPGTVDPYLLVSYLRAPSTVAEIQRMVRGQTAHLHPEDMANLQIPCELLNPSPRLKVLANLIRKETNLNCELNELAREQTSCAAEAF